MSIRNLSAILTCEGFARRDGRRVRDEDASFVAGPIDLGIENGLIVSQTSGDEIDGTNCLAIPGYIDPHTHAIFSGDRSAEYFMRWAGKSYLEISQAGGGIHSTVRATNAASDSELISDCRSRLRRMIRTGATTIEVKSGYGNSAESEIRLLRIIAALKKEVDLPEIRASFLGLHALPKDRSEREYVDEMIAALPSIVKENLADQVDSFPEKGFFSLDQSLRFSQASKLPAKVHADELSDLGTSAAFAKIGALSVDHLQCISDSGVEALSKSKTVATMLPATSFFVGIPYANARRLLDAGARVALASDFNPGTAPASDLQLTHMLAASQMKMTAAEILCASTFNAAAALGLEQSHGALSAGKVANVLLFDAEGIASSADAMRRVQAIIIGREKPKVVISRGRVFR